MKNNPIGIEGGIIAALKEGAALLIEQSQVLKKEGQSTIEEYLKNKSIEIDDFVSKVEKLNLRKCMGGEVSLIFDGPCNFSFVGEIFFIDKNNKWTKEVINFDSIPMDWCFYEAEQEKLRHEKKLTFKYES